MFKNKLAILKRLVRKYTTIIAIVVLAFPILIFFGINIKNSKTTSPAFERAELFTPTKTPSETSFFDKLPTINNYKYMPDSCVREGFQSTKCQQDFQNYLDQNCNSIVNDPNCTQVNAELFDFLSQQPCLEDQNSPLCTCLKDANGFDTPICEVALNNALLDFLKLSCTSNPNSVNCACSKEAEPGKCLSNIIGGDLTQRIACPVKLAIDAALGFTTPTGDVDCTDYTNSIPGPKESSGIEDLGKNLGKNLGNLNEIGLDLLDKNIQSTDDCVNYPYSPKCKRDCENQAYSGFLDYGCSEYYKTYCTTIDYASDGCRQVIYQEFPGVADFCFKFPNIPFCLQLGL